VLRSRPHSWSLQRSPNSLAAPSGTSSNRRGREREGRKGNKRRKWKGRNGREERASHTAAASQNLGPALYLRVYMTCSAIAHFTEDREVVGGGVVPGIQQDGQSVFLSGVEKLLRQG